MFVWMDGWIDVVGRTGFTRESVRPLTSPHLLCVLKCAEIYACMSGRPIVSCHRHNSCSLVFCYVTMIVYA